MKIRFTDKNSTDRGAGRDCVTLDSQLPLAGPRDFSASSQTEIRGAQRRTRLPRLVGQD